MDTSLESIYSLLDQTVNKEEIFAKARQVRSEHFGDEVFAYGFNYFSTYCLNRCNFCSYRIDNKNAVRYRNPTAQIVEDAQRLADSGVHMIDLTMGEDPHYKFQPERFADLINAVQVATELPIMISPGVVEVADLKLFKQAGATWFALYQETFVREAYERLRVNQDFDERLELKKEAIRAGLLVEEGIMTGWGDGVADAVESLLQMGKTQPSQVRVMTFVPQKDTPMQALEQQSNERELLMIAAMRLLYPSKLIPASLDVEGPKGLAERLNAGANVITSLIPSHSGLVGVASKSDIEDDGRSLPQVLPIIQKAGLRLASQSCFNAYVQAALEEHAYFGRTKIDDLDPLYVSTK